MLSKKNCLTGLVAGLALAVASSASAQPDPVMNLNDGLANHTVVGGVVAAPYFTEKDNRVFTAILVTNTLDSDTVMHMHVLDGDAGDDANWGEQDIYCGMTPNETTLILFQNNGSGPRMKVECSDEGRAFSGADSDSIVDRQPGQVVSIPLNGERGTLVINSVDVTDESQTTNDDRYIADWTVVDLANGTAISAEALHFQDASVDDDGAIFWGDDFPAVLGADFFAPTQGGEIVTEILLLTLDGKPGTPPQQIVDGWVYNDDEVKQSWQAREWACMDLFALTDLDASFLSNELCDANAPLGCVGHVVLNPLPAFVNGSVHDAKFGDFGGGGSEEYRQSLFDGWIIHRYNSTGFSLLPADGEPLGGIENSAATVRLLNRSSETNEELASDSFGLDLR